MPSVNRSKQYDGPRRAWAWLLFLGFLTLYGLWPSRVYSGDDLQYAMVIQQAGTGARFYHPAGGTRYQPRESGLTDRITSIPFNVRYLLEWPTSLATFKLWQSLGWKGDAIPPILLTRALFGALGILWFFLAVDRLTNRPALAGIAALGLGSTAGYWTYSTHVDQSIIMVAFLSLALYVFARQHESRSLWPRSLTLATVLALASFYNLTASLTAPSFALGLSLRDRAAGRKQARAPFFYTLTIYATLVASGILLSVVSRSPAQLNEGGFWRAAFFAGRPEFGVEPIRDAARAVLGLGKSQVLYPGVTGSLQAYWDDADRGARQWFLAYYGIVAGIQAVPFAFLLVRRRRLQADRQAVALMLIVWFIVYFAFDWFWDPGYNKYWLIPLLVWWTAAAFVLADLHETNSRWRSPAVALTVALAIFSLTSNLLTQVLPEGRADADRWTRTARVLAATPRNALFISSSGHPIDFNLAFFAKRDIVSVPLLEYDMGGDVQAVTAKVTSRVADHRADGGPVYVYGLEGLMAAGRARVVSMLGNAPLREAWTFPGLMIYEAMP